MPNRYIREAAIESEAVNSLSWQGEVFFRRLLNRVDDFGRFTANHSLLRAAAFPLQLAKVRESDIPRLLLECEQAGLLFVYTTESGKQCLVINKWENGRAKSSEHPPPPGDVLERMQTFVYNCKHELAKVPDSDPDSDPDTDSDNRPPGALDSPEFIVKWGEYVAYRREMKFKPLLARSVVKQWRQMESWGPHAAMAAIDTTIANQWQGLFAPKGLNRNGAGPSDEERMRNPNLRV